MIAIPAEQNGESKSDDENDSSSDEDSEWEYDERSAFGVFSD